MVLVLLFLLAQLPPLCWCSSQVELEIRECIEGRAGVEIIRRTLLDNIIETCPTVQQAYSTPPPSFSFSLPRRRAYFLDSYRVNCFFDRQASRRGRGYSTSLFVPRALAQDASKDLRKIVSSLAPSRGPFYRYAGSTLADSPSLSCSWAVLYLVVLFFFFFSRDHAALLFLSRSPFILHLLYPALCVSISIIFKRNFFI